MCPALGGFEQRGSSHDPTHRSPGRRGHQRWKSGYEEPKGLRDEMGVQDDEVFRSFDDGNDLTVTHDVTSPDAAKAFVADPHLAAVKELGVTGEPEIWIVDQT